MSLFDTHLMKTAVEINFAEHSRTLRACYQILRASNTEPIIRLISEAESDAKANALADRVAKAAGLP